MASKQSLYDRLGGEAGIATLVDRFYARVLADPKLGAFFKGVPMDKLRAMQREFFSAALGGPSAYTGRPLNHAHAGHGITLKDFSRFAGNLVDTLTEMGIPEADVQAVVSRIAVYANEITGDSAMPG